MTTPDIQFKLRLPASLKARLEEAAEIEGRSLSAEIVQRLEASFPDVEQEFLTQRMNELMRLRASIDRSVADLSTYQKRLSDEALSPGERDWLSDVVRRYEQEIARLNSLKARIQGDIAAIAGKSGG